MTEQSKRQPTEKPPEGERRSVGRHAGAVLLVGALFTCGCESIDRPEAAWLALHAVDVAQTLNAADDPCYKEDSWLTRRLIGEQPSDGEVLAWGAGTAVAHYLIGRALETSGAPLWLQHTWDATTIGHTGYTVIKNHQDGVRPWGNNQPVNGC